MNAMYANVPRSERGDLSPRPSRWLDSLFLSVAALLCAASAAAQDVAAHVFSAEPFLDVADILPDSVAVAGSTQGFAVHGRYAFSLHDGGQCVVVDMKRRRFVSSFVLEGNTGHCNNASFGVEYFDRRSQFPLLYVSECRGGRACYVNDVTAEGSRLVQTIYYDGEECTGPMDWCVDAASGSIYIYCTIGKLRMFKRFRIPRLSDSDLCGEVHLRPEDSLGSIPVGDVVIPQGSLVHGRRLYLPDGVPPRDRRLHVVDIVTARRIGCVDLNGIEYEPEGLAVRRGRLYISFHTPREPRHNRIYRFRVK